MRGRASRVGRLHHGNGPIEMLQRSQFFFRPGEHFSQCPMHDELRYGIRGLGVLGQQLCKRLHRPVARQPFGKQDQQGIRIACRIGQCEVTLHEKIVVA